MHAGRRPPRAAAAPATDEAFLDLVCADDELVRAAFEAIVAEEWPVPPSWPPPACAAGFPPPEGRERRRPLPPDDRPVQCHRPGTGVRRQRSPPPPARIRPT
jgi:hypothetical protein